MARKWFRLLAVMLALCLIAAACGSDDDDGGEATDDGVETPSAGEEAGERCEATVAGSQVNYGVYAPTASIDPPYVSGALVGGTEIINVYDVLVRYDHETGEYEPKLAESIEPNDDFTKWTLKLREGITYSDGTPLDAQMVSDSIDRFFATGVRNTSAGFMTSITAKTVVDPLTLEFELDAPWATFPFVLSDEPGMIVNTKAIGDDPTAFGATPPDAAGVGPYVVERNVPGEELVLKARSDYWDGPVCIETLRFVFVPGPQATYDAFRSGQLDVGFLRDPVVISSAKDAGEEGFFIAQDAGATILPNLKEGRPASDPLVREAIMLGLDDEVINQRAYGGKLETGRSLIAKGSTFFSDAVEAFPKNTDRAKKALEEAKAGGFDGKIELLCSSAPPAPETALASQGLLEAVGFDVTVRTLPTAEQIGEVVKGNYDAACWGLNADPTTGPTTFYRAFHSTSAVNRQGYANPEMDDALQDVLAAGTPDELKAAMAVVNNIVIDDNVIFTYGAPEEGVVWKEGITGIRPTSATMFLFDKAYIQE